MIPALTVAVFATTIYIYAAWCYCRAKLGDRR